MTDIKQALENLLDEDKDSCIELQDFTCSISRNINNVSSYYVAASYFLAGLRNSEPKTITVNDSNGNEFFVTFKE